MNPKNIKKNPETVFRETHCAAESGLYQEPWYQYVLKANVPGSGTVPGTTVLPGTWYTMEPPWYYQGYLVVRNESYCTRERSIDYFEKIATRYLVPGSYHCQLAKSQQSRLYRYQSATSSSIGSSSSQRLLQAWESPFKSGCHSTERLSPAILFLDNQQLLTGKA